MNARLYQELERRSATEKRALGEALIVSADSEASAALVTEAQRAELRSRLVHYRAHPEEPGVGFSELKGKLLGDTRRA